QDHSSQLCRSLWYSLPAPAPTRTSSSTSVTSRRISNSSVDDATLRCKPGSLPGLAATGRVCCLKCINPMSDWWNSLRRSEAKGGADDRAVQGDIVEEAAVVEIDGQVAVTGRQRDRLGDLVLQRAHHLPVDVGGGAEAADVALGLQREARAELEPAVDA